MRLFSYRAFGEDKQMLALLCRRCSSRLAAVHPDSKLNNGLFSHSQSVKMSEKFVYRLCGLSAALHMRPTSFQAPLPATRVCSVCGVVPEKIALLPCCHPVCQCCFEVFVSKENICSLDEKRFKEEQVEWLEFSEKQLTGHLVSHNRNIQNILSEQQQLCSMVLRTKLRQNISFVLDVFYLRLLFTEQHAQKTR